MVAEAVIHSDTSSHHREAVVARFELDDAVIVIVSTGQTTTTTLTNANLRVLSYPRSTTFAALARFERHVRRWPRGGRDHRLEWSLARIRDIARLWPDRDSGIRRQHRRGFPRPRARAPPRDPS